MHKHLRHALATATLLAASAAQATPYAIHYDGAIGATLIPTIPTGERYTMTLVFDNDSSGPNSQTWQRGHLVCAVLHFGNAGTAVLAQNLAAGAIPDGSGSVTTNASGALTGIFGPLYSPAITPANTTVLNLPAPTVANDLRWEMGDDYPILAGEGAQGIGSAYDDSTGGNPPANIARWSAPVEWPHACDTSAPRPAAPVPGPGPAATPVPTLSEWGVLLLSGLLLMLGIWRWQRA